MNPLDKGSQLQTKSLWLFGKARWLVGVILFLLGTTATILGVPALGNQIRSDVPGLRCWFPVPMESGKFTIAMAPFVTVSGDPEAPKARITQDGRQLARLLYTHLESNFGALDLDIPYELRSPDENCPIKGSTREERAAAAEAWANKINADVLIYGAIQEGATDEGAPEGATSELQPEFYVAYRGFTEASELVGPYELGRPLSVAIPIQSDVLEGIADHPVNARAQALSLIALGLASYVVDDYEGALDYFLAADEVPNWPASAGKEMLYLLMGNTASRLAATTLDSAYVDEALDYFDQALEIDPDFARALAGEASALYQLALGNLQTRQASQVDLDLLDEAEALFRKAADSAAPEAAEVSLKTHFGLGQIFLVRHYLQAADPSAMEAGAEGNTGDDWLEKARSEFQTMVDSYVANGARNHDLIGHAYARLGLIANQLDKEPRAAIPLYEEAIDLVTPRWQAQYRLDLGDVYVALEDVEQARRAYEEAQAVAELYGNEALVERAEEKLAALP